MCMKTALQRACGRFNQNRIDEDLKYAGYNLILSSELHMNPNQVYHTYLNL